MVALEPGLVKASRGYDMYAGRLPWSNRPGFYNAISRGEVSSVRFGTAIYVPRWALEALANGDVDALRAEQHSEPAAV
jgi:hypothetical protein